ncbi:MOSC domain-containing protein YiiM [Mesocricetibacter intestinalis]|uniref:MOSC domain-containing protein YiiM n=1 Tax=Mesocricetibacter intestinalis TaxID=1521930 RepID=A0A4R6V9V4_9PAST|nr:MOSC domain-containing protein [Mesocricetibacter intestinalis]TDQ56383.1 MOSC domain-containing protein YiiM [Mesocricetibacter intestinalis]
MSKLQIKILQIKIGKACQQQFADGSSLWSAIRKIPVEGVFVNAQGAEGNEVGLSAHHGGVDKALFFMAADSFERLNQLSGCDFDYKDSAVYGENFILSGCNESNVCIGDIYRIGEALIEISQPRRPCERLSLSSANPDMQDIIFDSGLTGWYVRVLEGGEIRRNQLLELCRRPYPQWTIQRLNLLLSGPLDRTLIEQALQCDKLAAAFKRALHKKLEGHSGKV